MIRNIQEIYLQISQCKIPGTPLSQISLWIFDVMIPFNRFFYGSSDVMILWNIWDVQISQCKNPGTPFTDFSMYLSEDPCVLTHIPEVGWRREMIMGQTNAPYSYDVCHNFIRGDNSVKNGFECAVYDVLQSAVAFIVGFGQAGTSAPVGGRVLSVDHQTSVPNNDLIVSSLVSRGELS